MQSKCSFGLYKPYTCIYIIKRAEDVISLIENLEKRPTECQLNNVALSLLIQLTTGEFSAATTTVLGVSSDKREFE